ncbi:hypothetical protein ACOMHN_000179 [Nucella lapillus]
MYDSLEKKSCNLMSCRGTSGAGLWPEVHGRQHNERSSYPTGTEGHTGLMKGWKEMIRKPLLSDRLSGFVLTLKALLY